MLSLADRFDSGDEAARPRWRPGLALRCLPGSVLAGGTVSLAIVMALALAPFIAPCDPATQDLAHRLAGPSALHWLGTDNLGRDLFSRTLYGGRFCVTVTALSLAAAAASGTLLGAVSARARGWVDEVVMRGVDFSLSFPDVIVALFLVAIFGTGYATLIAAMTLANWTPFARVMRGLTLEINGRDYIKAAEILNCSRRFIILRHVVPNTIRPMAAITCLRFGHMLITVGGLSFLGLGAQPPVSDWGAMVAESVRYMGRMPMLMLAPGLAIFVTALAVTVLGKGLDAPGGRRP